MNKDYNSKLFFSGAAETQQRPLKMRIQFANILLTYYFGSLVYQTFPTGLFRTNISFKNIARPLVLLTLKVL